MSSPLVSCIMPTAGRRRFVPLAFDHFLRQHYPERELVVVDDGEEPVEDLVPPDPRIRYLRIARGLSLGAKRNLACEQARGDVIAHWDDDDWHAPHRLTVQTEALLASGAELCGINRLLFFEPATGRAWEYAYPPTQRAWLSGSTLMYRRRFWETHRFANVNVGEDAKFVWSGDRGAMRVLDDHAFHVGMVHGQNTSPKRTRGRWWREIPADPIRSLLGPDLDAHVAAASVTVVPPPAAPRVPVPAARVVARPIAPPLSAPLAAPPARNVFACLVHESPQCVVDLVRNLRHLDPESSVLLHDGGDGSLPLARQFDFERLGAEVHPAPRPMRWGALHGFALDCMRHALRTREFDTLTIVDSDQLGVRPGYSRRLGALLRDEPNVGLLGNSPGVQGRTTRVAPAVTAWREVDLWRPFLRRFPHGEEQWVRWSFWPSTVFTADACRALVDLFDHDAELHAILERSKLWATEEILFPTLTALLGFRVVANPCSYDYVRYRVHYSAAQLRAAMARDDVYWIHPVPRRYEHPLRHQVRAACHHYRRSAPAMTASPPRHDLPLTLPILARIKGVEGWLEDDEADLLIAATRDACRTAGLEGRIVEIGSYCGRATIAIASAARDAGHRGSVYAIDPHDGRIGAADQGLRTVPPTRERFLRNVAAAGVADMVELVQQHAWEVTWSGPVALLVVDHLHDYVSVARDFRHFEPHLAPGALVAFHDYADFYPGVMAFVDELLAEGTYEPVGRVRTMVLLRRVGEPRPAG